MLISNAYAQAAGSDPTGGLMGLLPLILMFIVLWFLMIRPQMKRAKEHKAMVEGLAKGDEVITGGGIAGRVTEVGDSFVQVEVAANTVIAVQKQAVASVLPKGTLKSL
ncbi:preprotein translocase subunit YajC [Thauera sp.]|uniref:preprotein translocase subunit YajC n=1 Tax=Thauera sp. TaxID=1905334 RepID=UPI0039E3AE29